MAWSDEISLHRTMSQLAPKLNGYKYMTSSSWACDHIFFFSGHTISAD